MTTVGIVIIGDEILSGKVQDTNSYFLARELHGLGAQVECILVIPDVVEEIAEKVRDFSQRYDFVITSGGVGPTHDDRTIEGIAQAFEREVLRSEELADILRRHLQREPNEAQLKMTEIPEGSELIYPSPDELPVLLTDNVFIFPGIPKLLTKKFTAIRERFQTDPYYQRIISMKTRESDLAEAMNQISQLFPEVKIGSYPKILDEGYFVRITLEAKEEERVQQATEALLQRFPAQHLLSTE